MMDILFTTKREEDKRNQGGTGESAYFLDISPSSLFGRRKKDKERRYKTCPALWEVVMQ
jgi:hypothetical protein